NGDMGVFKNISGRRFGRPVALFPIAQDGRKRTVWHCVCDCGGTARGRIDALTTGNAVSCGGCIPGRGGRLSRRHRIKSTESILTAITNRPTAVGQRRKNRPKPGGPSTTLPNDKAAGLPYFLGSARRPLRQG